MSLIKVKINYLKNNIKKKKDNIIFIKKYLIGFNKNYSFNGAQKGKLK
jgi:hypothetical protein